MATCKYHNFDEMRALEHQPGLDGKVATHHLKLYHLVSALESPLVVEFGVDKGRSTCVFLQACEETGGRLVSVDVSDCREVAHSNAWTFVQQDDLDRARLLAAVPDLQDGIDLLHIDSLHSQEHVRQLLMTWYRDVKAGGYITFHDVDPTPYLRGQRKDSPRHEPEALGMARVIKNFFYANEDDLFLEYHFGSTGMGIMRKLSPLGTTPKPPAYIRTRETLVTPTGLAWTARHGLSRMAKRWRS